MPWSHRSLIGLIAVWVCGCATSGVVRFETGQGSPVVYSPPGTAHVVEVGKREFLQTVSRLSEDRRLWVALAMAVTPEPSPWHSVTRPRFSWADGALTHPVAPQGRFTLADFSHDSDGRDDRFSHATFIGAAQNLSIRERQHMALSAALENVWDGVDDAVKSMVNPNELRAMLVSVLCSSLVLLLLPEPVTKFIALALTAYLVAYIGYFPVWNIIRAYGRLREDCLRAQSLRDLEDAGHRFGPIVGDNGARVLIMVALASVGGKAGLSSKGPTLPGYARAALTSEVNFGLRLSAVAEGSVTAIAVTSGTVVVSAAASAVASTAWGTGGSGPRPKGKLTGKPTRVRANADAETVRGLTRENESAQTLVENGYDVEQNPQPPPDARKKPDYRIGGEYYDCYAPKTFDVRNIASNIKDKVVGGQALKIVVNLNDAPVSIAELEAQIHEWPIPGLLEALVIKGKHLVAIRP